MPLRCLSGRRTGERQWNLSAPSLREPESPQTEDESPLERESRRFVREDEEAPLRQLLARQERAMPRAMEELRVHGRKTSHWAWWAFPTEKSGFSEPPPQTKITVETAPELIRRAPREWRQVLELIVHLVDASGDISAIVPPIDHGRIVYFIKFWREVDETPVWLHLVCDRLHAHLSTTLARTARSAPAAFANRPKSLPPRGLQTPLPAPVVVKEDVAKE